MDSEVIRFYFTNYEAVAAKALQLYNKVIANKNSEMKKQRQFPVIMLSAKSEEVDKIMGLNMGRMIMLQSLLHRWSF